MDEMFTFVTCSHIGHGVEHRYFSRREADTYFNHIVANLSASTGLFVAYYCATSGGLVNAHYAD
jgi:hypothetical protein